MEPTGSEAKDTGWMPALDGLRAIAVVAVVLFHFKTKHLLPGGSFGVDLFLALSGFLITTLLLREWRTTGTLNLRNFYIRRGLRLLPAMLVLCAVYGFVSIAFGSYDFAAVGQPAKVLESIGLALAYVINWAIAFENPVPKGFSHLWSLSLEEQFYLFWPAFLLLMLRFSRNLLILMLGTLLLVALSLNVPHLVIDGSFDGREWRRLYFGSDFRAHGLLIGSFAAQLCAAGLITAQTVQRRWFAATCAVAAVALGYYMTMTTDKAEALYLESGYALLSMSCSMLVLFAALKTGGVIYGFLTLPLLQYIGRRSYALYLWHVPIGFWVTSLPELPHLIVASGLSLAAAELSYRLVERRANGLKRRFESPRAGMREAPIVQRQQLPRRMPAEEGTVIAS